MSATASVALGAAVGIIVGLALGAAIAPAAEAAPRSVEPVAIVTELTGRGKVAQPIDGGPLELLHELQPGAVLTLEPAALAVVIHTASGAIFDLAGPGRFRVLPAAVSALDGARLSKRGLPPELKTFRLKPLAAVQASIVMRGDPAVRLEGPAGGVLSTDELVYRVRGNLTELAAELRDESGTVVARFAEPHIALMQAPIDAGRSYRLHARGIDGQRRPVELAAGFWLVEPATATLLRAARPGADASVTDLVVYALALEEAGATATAADVWRRVNSRR